MASIVKTVIGSGILTIPYTLNHLGYLFGTFLFFGAVFLNQFGSLLLLKAKNLSKHSNYSTILYEIWPSRISKGIGSAIIFLACMGVCKLYILLRYCRSDLLQNCSKKITCWYLRPIWASWRSGRLLYKFSVYRVGGRNLRDSAYSSQQNIKVKVHGTQWTYRYHGFHVHVHRLLLSLYIFWWFWR